jgi:hypothetical protein
MASLPTMTPSAGAPGITATEPICLRTTLKLASKLAACLTSIFWQLGAMTLLLASMPGILVHDDLRAFFLQTHVFDILYAYNAKFLCQKNMKIL